MPRWFNEGLAIHASKESRFLRMRTLWDATLSKKIIPLADLDQAFPRERYEVSIAYAQSADFVRFLLRDTDRDRFESMIERVRSGTPFERALTDAYGTDLRKLEYQWLEELAKRYTFVPFLTGGSLLWVLVFVVLVFGYLKRRKRTRETLERWAREEAEMDAAIHVEAVGPEIAPAVAAAPAFAPGGRPPLPSGLPKIEYEGRWHTLH